MSVDSVVSVRVDGHVPAYPVCKGHCYEVQWYTSGQIENVTLDVVVMKHNVTSSHSFHTASTEPEYFLSLSNGTVWNFATPTHSQSLTWCVYTDDLLPPPLNVTTDNMASGQSSSLNNSTEYYIRVIALSYVTQQSLTFMQQIEYSSTIKCSVDPDHPDSNDTKRTPDEDTSACML